MTSEGSMTDVDNSDQSTGEAMEVKHKVRHERRVKKAFDCVDSALEREDPFEASLAAMTGHLMYVNAQLDEAIRANLGDDEPTLERVRGVLPCLDMGLKVSRQIDRQVQILQRRPGKRDER